MRWAEADVDRRSSCWSTCAAPPGVRQIETAGSYRRGRETVGDLDLLVDADDVAAVMDRFGDVSGGRPTSSPAATRKCRCGWTTGLQVDLRVVPAESFGAALQYFTGSKDHNVVAPRHGQAARAEDQRVGRLSASDDEAAKRWDRRSPAAPRKKFTPRSTCRGFRRRCARRARSSTGPRRASCRSWSSWRDIRGDLHMHTTATDGQATLEEMVAAAQARGLEYIAITDHSKRVSMASGLDGDRLRRQWQRDRRRATRRSTDFVILKGVECDILERGGMDLPDDVLAEADWVIASVHYGQKQPREQITERILGAIENPHVDVDRPSHGTA